MTKPKYKRNYQNNDPFADREAQNYANPIPSREYILSYLEELGYPINPKLLAQAFEFAEDDHEEHEALLFRLKAMVRDGQLMCDRRGRFCLLNKLDILAGEVVSNAEGFGYVAPDNTSEPIYLNAREMRKVFHGDRVLVRPVERGRRGRMQGEIHEVLEYRTQKVVGRYTSEANHAFVTPDNKRLHHDIHITHDGHGDAQQGDIVTVEILFQPKLKTPPIGRVIEVLGKHMAAGMEIDIAIRSHNLPYEWPSEVLETADAFSADFSDADLSGRTDLRHLEFVTIDGADARDFDDAVYAEALPNGGWRLWVAIADVSHYVKPGSVLDQEAYLRGNSVYFPERVIPMLPHHLSDDLCSLKPHVDRLVMVCEMVISAAGDLTQSSFYPGIMHSKARLTYTEAAQLLAQDALQLRALHQLYQALSARRELRGALSFDKTETQIVFDEQRKIAKIIPIYRNDAHKLIEECMLLANVATANFLLKYEIPAVYRIHEAPNQDRTDDLRAFLSEVGLSLAGDRKPQTKDYSDLLGSIRERPDMHIIQTVLLRSLSQAMYSESNVGHFGLAYDAYTHFTSPIRRYPDLLVHRAIRHILSQQPIAEFTYSANECHKIARHCSETERRADDATRDVVGWLKCEYLQDHLGKEFNGVIAAVTGFGIFVELDDIYIEGLVHITGLKDDYYQFDAVKHRLVGEHTRTVYKLGDKLKVLVARVDLDTRKIDFDLA